MYNEFVMWIPLRTCRNPECNSENLMINQDAEYYKCNDCGATGSGSNFWDMT